VGITGVEDLVEEHEGEEEDDEDWSEMRSKIAGWIVSGADEVPKFWVDHSHTFCPRGMTSDTTSYLGLRREIARRIKSSNTRCEQILQSVH
jgi:hypothetical protein